MKRAYFNSLNYTIGNEDTALELEVMPENIQHVFAVAGSGSRIIPLLAKNPSYITCVDSSLEQLSLAELRIASMQALDYHNFLSFWGYPPREMSPTERQVVFNNLIISDQTRQSTRLLFEKHGWKSLLYVGKWEKTFQKLSSVNRWIVGNKGLEIFACDTKKKQEDYIKAKFPQRAFSFSVFLLGNAAIFNALLYKGNFPQKNLRGSMHKFYMERFGYLFEQDIARKNYFLQLLFFGKLKFLEGLPIECDREIFLKAKKAQHKTKIKYVLSDVLEEAKRATRPIDLLSLSDIPSYLKPPQEQEFLQQIKNSVSRGGIVINRYYLRMPENLNLDGYRNITNDFKEAIAKEKVNMYSFGIYQKT